MGFSGFGLSHIDQQIKLLSKLIEGLLCSRLDVETIFGRKIREVSTGGIKTICPKIKFGNKVNNIINPIFMLAVSFFFKLLATDGGMKSLGIAGYFPVQLH